MRQATDPIACAAHAMPAAILERQAAQERQMRQSNRAPYRQVARVLAAVYCVTVVAASALIGAWRRPHPSAIHRRLAEFFYYVPEMAVHKAIELEAFLRQPYEGRGVDLGCGFGQVGGILIAAAGLRDLHGVDTNGACHQSVLEAGYSNFTRCDIQALDLPDAAFDYAISVCVIEHIPNLERALSEIARVLRPGGRLVFSTPAPMFRESTLGYRFFRALGLRKRSQVFKVNKDLSAMQFHYLSGAEWKTALGRAGFREVVVEEIFSRQQMLVYDLLNIQVNWMRFYFADKLAVSLGRHPLLRRRLVAATQTLAACLGSGEARGVDEGTHYLITCTRTADFVVDTKTTAGVEETR